MTGWRDVLKIHPAAELFPPMEPEELRALGEDIKQNGMKIPIVLWVPKECYSKCPDTGRLIYTRRYLIDGRNRLDAAELVGVKIGSSLETIPHEVFYEPSDHLPRQGYRKLADPYAYVISANIHRRHLTGAQKDELTEALLKARPERSDRAIAKDVKVDHKTVAAKRKKLEAGGEIPHQDKRTGTDGKAQSTTKTKPKHPKPAASPPAAPAPPPLAQAAPPPHPVGTLGGLETLAGMYLSASFEDQLALFSGWFAQLTIAQQSGVREVMGKQ